MGAQSLVIGKMFGEGFQYGKRKISAMPNEEFNRLSFEDMMSNARTEMQASIPTMQKALQDMQPMVETVVHEFTNYLSLVLERAPKELGQVTQSIREVTGFNKVNDMLVKLIAEAKTGLAEQDLLKELRLLQIAFAEDMPIGDTPSTGSIPLTPSITSPSGQKVPIIGTTKTPFIGPLVDPLTGETPDIISSLRNLPPPLYRRSVKAAGQSQKLAKRRFESGIIGSVKALAVKGNSNNYRFGLMKALEKQRQDLANLLAWYRF